MKLKRGKTAPVANITLNRHTRGMTVQYTYMDGSKQFHTMITLLTGTESMDKKLSSQSSEVANRNIPISSGNEDPSI
jgi:hypothetical protein